MIFDKLMRIQTEIKAPKNLYNSFGKYRYRNAEGICEAVKPYLAKENVSLTLTDEIVEVGGRIYVKATAVLVDAEKGGTISATAYAREASEKKGMDDSQITGTASSYARKYALNGLFLLDDTKDADTDEYKQQLDAKAEQQKGEEEAEKLGKEKITAVMAKALQKRCETEGVPVEFLLKAYKIESLEEMTNAQYRNASDKWASILEKAKG